MKKFFIFLIIIKFNFMYAQQSSDNKYEVITFEESLKYDLKTMKDYKYSSYNQSTALFINNNRILIFPNLNGGRCLITSKDTCDEIFSNNSFPLLPENDTPYFRYKEIMNKEGFTLNNINKILADLGLQYNESTFYSDAEKLSNTLSVDNKKKLLIAMLFFIGEELHNLCPKAEWRFTTEYYFQPFNVPILNYEEHSHSFYDLNVLLEEKLLKNKNITFKNILKRVKGYYDKEKLLWEKR